MASADRLTTLVIGFAAWLGILKDETETLAIRKRLRELLTGTTDQPKTRGWIDDIFANRPSAERKKPASWNVIVRPLLGITEGGERRDRIVPRHIRTLLEKMPGEELVALAEAWENYLSRQSDAAKPAPLRETIFGSLVVPGKQYDIVVWAHSDQKGGTELACTLALAFRAATGGRLSVAIAAPVPEYVSARYGQPLSDDVIQTPLLMHPEKHRDGGVDPERTYEVFRKLFPIHRGGGKTWDEILRVLDDLCRQGQPRAFSLLIRSNPASFQVKWHLFPPGATNPTALDPPKRMLHWYALTDLVVGRGGLVAQQVLACAYGLPTRAPRLPFVEDPGHPQIESARRKLAQSGLVSTVELKAFRESPLGPIQRSLDWLKDHRDTYVRNVHLRYGRPVLSELAAMVVEKYCAAQPSRHRDTRVTYVPDAAKRLAGVKVLVTGSHGFIGRQLVRELQRLGAQIVEYDLRNGCNILNRRQLAESASGASGTFHLAGASSVVIFNEDSANAWKTTVEGLTNVLAACEGRIVFPSTASICGSSAVPAAEIRALPDPVNAYAKAKSQCEHLCFAANKDVRVFRIFSGYGPGDHAKGDAASPVAKFLASAAAGESAEIYGDGRQVRDFVFVDDIVNALIAVAKPDVPNGSRVFNVGTGIGTTFLDLIKVIRSASNLGAIDKHMRTQPSGYVESLVAHTARAERELGFRTIVDLPEGLKRTIQSDFPRLTRR